MKSIDLLIINIGELLTIAQTDSEIGNKMDDLGIIYNGAIAIEDGKISDVGSLDDIIKNYSSKNIIDAKGKVVMPGFVDPHTHPVFVNTREKEFEMRIQGKTYKEISQTGGGIRSSISDVRAASKETLYKLGMKRIEKMLQQGTTTIEAKSGYGLSTESEIKMLEVIRMMGENSEMDIKATFLGAHEFPEEYKDNREKYIEILMEKMLPAVAERELAEYCDIFCEEHVFTVDESRKILLRAKELGFKIRMHADELEPIGGAELAAEIGAISADHLVAISDNGITAMKNANVFPILLPGTTFSLGLKNYAPARKMIAAGLPVALATDFNPGSCNCDSMQTVISLACLQMKMLPAEAIAASTRNAALSLEIGDKIGTLEKGKQADILIMDMPSYRYLPYHLGSNCVKTVIKNGKIINFNQI
ncbi:MAG: imidazolonepropionase [Candidatus Cloacimonadota bacterium]|nr:imidazolonepropionase [Candidatus Cloacimonadota bacterium]